MLVWVPSRHAECIALFPGEFRFADDGIAAPGDDMIDGRCGLPPTGRGASRADSLGTAAEDSANWGVSESLDVVQSVRPSHTFMTVRSKIAACHPWFISTIQLRLHLRPGENQGRLLAVNVLRWVPRLSVMLDKMHGEVAEIRQIQAIQPDHGARSVLAVVMVVPSGSQDHIPLLHANPATMNGRETAVTLDDEAHRERCVTVRRGGFVRHDQLETGVQRVGCVGGLCMESLNTLCYLLEQRFLHTSCRIHQHQDASLRLLLRDQLPCREQVGPDELVFPHKRNADGIRLGGIQTRHLRPQRERVGFPHFFEQLLLCDLAIAG